MAENRTCPVCGETAPTAWICVTRLAGVAKPGEPCGYSIEGDARGNERLNAATVRLAETIADQWATDAGRAALAEQEKGDA